MYHVNSSVSFVASSQGMAGRFFPMAQGINWHTSPFIPTFAQPEWNYKEEWWQLPRNAFDVIMSKNRALVVVPGRNTSPSCFLTATILAPASVQRHFDTFRIISRNHGQPLQAFFFRTEAYHGMFTATELRPGHQLAVRVSGESSVVYRHFWDGNCCRKYQYSLKEWQQRFRHARIAA
ncbi:hypothetical protein HY491_04615 [Candidatus Woesearchaeota archaeon]|nr:hypothetical protein [Candidatus Woesearchaeota archaeon]